MFFLRKNVCFFVKKKYINYVKLFYFFTYYLLMENIKQTFASIVVLWSLFIFQWTHAANEVQEQCFEDLKINMQEIVYFGDGRDDVSSMSYSDLESKFSRNYKNMSSFGIDLDEALFELRIYTFGQQTGYIHPPYSPYPIYEKTDKWDEAAKEYIVAEEYVTLPTGEKQFLSCSFMQIEAQDLMKVTSENYLWDGDIISVIQVNGEDYKVWYNENESFDPEGNPLVTWRRLFVYPKATQNDYFNKYDVLDQFPTNVVENLKDMYLLDANGEIYQFADGEWRPEWEWANAMLDGSSRLYVNDEDGQVIEYLWDEDLAPVEKEGLDQIFALNSYYQAIENKFPEFSEKMAIRWVVHYDTLKEVLATGDDDDFAYVWETVLDPRAITVYALEKKNGTLQEEDAFYEDELSNIDKIESNILSIINASSTGETDTTQTGMIDDDDEDYSSSSEDPFALRKNMEARNIIMQTLEDAQKNRNAEIIALVAFLLFVVVTFVIFQHVQNWKK